MLGLQTKAVLRLQGYYRTYLRSIPEQSSWPPQPLQCYYSQRPEELANSSLSFTRDGENMGEMAAHSSLQKRLNGIKSSMGWESKSNSINLTYIQNQQPMVCMAEIPVGLSRHSETRHACPLQNCYSSSIRQSR